MLLSIRDRTGLLQADESTVSRWIRSQSLPAQQVGGPDCVHRAELQQRATANVVQTSLEPFDYFNVDNDLPSWTCARQRRRSCGKGHPGLSLDSPRLAIFRPVICSQLVSRSW